MNERLSEELTHILRDSLEQRSGLSREELKTLALELAAAMPPIQRTTTDADPEVSKALEKLTNCEGVLTLAIKAYDAKVVDVDEWRISEAFHGALKLLQGCYTTLSHAVGQP